jgi:hydroxyethylthiazole kinase-like uncharacterized protein yjeF
MTELLTAAQMRAIEKAAIASGEVTGLELMERAGRGVVEAIFEEWPELKKAPHRAVVLCGPGNNGGDGFVVARLLREWGWEVEVFIFGRSDPLPSDAAANYQRWMQVSGTSDPIQSLNPWVGAGDPHPDIVVDAIFGTGLTRPLPTPVSRAFSFLKHRSRVVAIDLPSGLCSDSGRFVRDDPEDTALAADLTVTFQERKLGHLLADGPSLCGKVIVKDIGLRAALFYEEAVCESEIFRDDIAKAGNCHKYTCGHALILAGSSGKGGAARLAARGALRIGAGLVTLGCPPEAIAENAARLDAVMLRTVADAEALADTLADPRITALCLGPGLGTGAREVALLAAALGVPAPGSTKGIDVVSEAPRGRGGPGSSPGRGRGQRGLVLDADALTLLTAHPDLFAALHETCILTPHAGEFARLFPDIAEKLNAPAIKGPAYSKVDATREAAKRAGCTVLFKGPDTVISDPEGRSAINSAHYERAAPWLATAGSGDVLAGFVAGLLARGLSPMQAAETAAWLHVECARSFGPGLIAEDLSEELPKVFRALGL